MFRDVLLEAAGSLRRSYEDVEWSQTPLGPIEEWNDTLRNAAHLALNTQFPVGLFWGPEFVLVYNEAFVQLIADKHPAALGRRARDVFPEAWETIGPWMEAALAGTGATWIEDASVPLVRHGALREAYFTFSYSPVRGADGAIEGVMDIATETTRQVVDRRRLETLGRLRELLGTLERADDVRSRAIPLLRANADDFASVGFESATPPATRSARRPLSGGEVVLEDTGAGRVARLPLGPAHGGAQRPVLVVGLSERLAPDEAYLGFLRLIASSLGQALDRISAREAERGMAAAERSLSEALQRSLLIPPLQPDHLQVAVRYLPAAEQAQVGGDWYDSFMGPEGSLTLVIGDVTGHDRQAVAAMAQVRNLLRGLSYAMQVSPAQVLTAVDGAMYGLAVGTYATAVLAHVEQDQAERDRGVRTLRWSNAGHPPPVLLGPDGRARLLETRPEILLGLGAGEHTDHVVTIEPGASIVFYTDGLVERRRIPLQDRLEWLTSVLEGRSGLSAEELCDHLLGHLEESFEDDVALLVLRAHPEDAPRPAEAGPAVLPADVRRTAANRPHAG